MTKWSVETLDEVVNEELTSLPMDMRGRFVRVSQLIEEFGPFNVGMPHVKRLDGKLWEIRVSGRDAIGRGIYVVATARRLIVLHVKPSRLLQEPCKPPSNAPRTLDCYEQNHRIASALAENAWLQSCI